MNNLLKRGIKIDAIRRSLKDQLQSLCSCIRRLPSSSKRPTAE